MAFNWKLTEDDRLAFEEAGWKVLYRTIILAITALPLVWIGNNSYETNRSVLILALIVILIEVPFSITFWHLCSPYQAGGCIKNEMWLRRINTSLRKTRTLVAVWLAYNSLVTVICAALFLFEVPLRDYWPNLALVFSLFTAILMLCDIHGVKKLHRQILEQLEAEDNDWK